MWDGKYFFHECVFLNGRVTVEVFLLTIEIKNSRDARLHEVIVVLRTLKYT